MRYYWDRPVEQRRVHVAECETCESKVIVLLAPIVNGEGMLVGYGVNCTKCFTMLNAQQNIAVGDAAADELFMLTGSRLLPHFKRYNPKVNPLMKHWLEMRWRHV